MGETKTEFQLLDRGRIVGTVRVSREAVLSYAKTLAQFGAFYVPTGEKSFIELFELGRGKYPKQ
ncbi:MAG: hypothetical protein WC613_00010 [Candidatus Aenigmatarchaeota archaeon]